jgi:hypothetical protein
VTAIYKGAAVVVPSQAFEYDVFLSYRSENYSARGFD